MFLFRYLNGTKAVVNAPKAAFNTKKQHPSPSKVTSHVCSGTPGERGGWVIVLAWEGAICSGGPGWEMSQGCSWRV